MKVARLTLVGGLAAVFLTGCAAYAPESKMAEAASMAPGSWAATKEGTAGVDRDWVRRFGDSRLTATVNEAMRNNLDLRVAAERVRRAEATARLVGGNKLPQVNASLDGRKQQQRFIGLPFGGSAISENYGASVDVNWELDMWGRIRAGESAALGEMQAVGYDLEAARTSLAGQLAKAWFALGEANEQIELAKAALKIRRDTFETIRDRFERAIDGEGGTGSQLRLAQTDVASARAVLAQWEGAREQSLRQIELLAGRYPSGKNLSERGLPSLPSHPPVGLPSELLLRRPDILAAERRFAASGKSVKEARLALWPSFSLTGSLGTATDSLDEVLNSNFGIWSLGAGVVQPIFTGGRATAEMRARESDERAARSTLQQTVLTAFGEVEQALVAETFLAKRHLAQLEAAKLAEEAATAAENDYADGSIDVLTLLAAQSRRIATATELVSLKRTRLENRVNLHLALGGSFTTRGK